MTEEYHIAFSDIDGTLLDGGGHVTTETPQAVHQIQAMRVPLMLS